MKDNLIFVKYLFFKFLKRPSERSFKHLTMVLNVILISKTKRN